MSNVPPPPGGEQPQQPGGYPPPQPPQQPPAQPPQQPPGGAYQAPQPPPGGYQPPPGGAYQPPAGGYQQPNYAAQGIQPPPASSSSGSGCLKAFLIVLVIGVVLSIGAVIVFGFVINKAVDETVGTADASDYKVEITDCSVDSTDNPQASGTITNTDDKNRGYSIDVVFKDSGGTIIDTTTVYSGSLVPDERYSWDAFSFSDANGGPVSCEVRNVSYFFN